MSMPDPDPSVPAALLASEPLFRAFRRSHHGLGHSRASRTTLPLVALWLALDAEDERNLDWGALDPDALVAEALAIDHQELGFLEELLDVAAAFYGFLGDVGALPIATADRIRARLAAYAVGVAQRAAA